MAGIKASAASEEFGQRMRMYRKKALVSLDEIASTACMQAKDLVAVEEGRVEISDTSKDFILKFFPEIDKVEL